MLKCYKMVLQVKKLQSLKLSQSIIAGYYQNFLQKDAQMHKTFYRMLMTSKCEFSVKTQFRTCETIA